MSSTLHLSLSLDDPLRVLAAAAAAAEAEADMMSKELAGINRTRRDSMAGFEPAVFDLVFQACSSDKWMEWLKTPVEYAADRGDHTLVTRLIGAGAPAGKALLRAIERGQEKMVDRIVEQAGVVQDFAGEGEREGDTPLHVAAELGHKGIVQLLIQRGADKNGLGRKNRTPLHLAAKAGNLAVAEVLMDAGADLNLRDAYGETVLTAAARYNHPDVVRAIARHGVDVNSREKVPGITVLHLMANSDNAEVTEALLEAGADADLRSEGGGVPLHVAARQGSLRVASALLKGGADVNARDEEGRVPLHHATVAAGKYGTAECVDLLLRWGADETAKTKDEGVTPADVVGRGVLDWMRDEEDCCRVRELLANASKDRMWRRRGLLVICRARSGIALRGEPDCPPKARDNSSSSEAELGGSRDDGHGGELRTSILLKLTNEDIFRKIVMFL